MATVSIYEDNNRLRSLLELLISGQDEFTLAGAYADGLTIIEQTDRDLLADKESILNIGFTTPSKRPPIQSSS